jgi:transposase
LNGSSQTCQPTGDPVRTTTTFNKLLNLQGAFVRAVAFSAAAVIVTVTRRARRHQCPRCTYSTHARYDSHVGEWRHVPLGKWQVRVRAEVARIECPRHGVLTEKVPWAVPDSRFTLDFEEMTAWLAREMDITAVTLLMHIAWRSVGRIIKRVVDRKLDRTRLENLYVIGMDEVSYRKGQKYLSIVANHESGDPVWIGEGRSRETVSTFFDELGEERTKKLEVVTMDMSGSYIEEVKHRAPQAEIAFDPFHVVKLSGEALNEIRREEWRPLKGTEVGRALKGTRWVLLKAPEKLKPDERLKLAAVAELNVRLYRAYLLKEELRALYRCEPAEAETHLDSWLSWARRSRLRPFVKLAKTIHGYREGVLAAIRLGVSNGRLEGINNKIGVIKHRAYGFHSAAALIAMIFLCCTNIQVNLPI